MPVPPNARSRSAIADLVVDEDVLPVPLGFPFLYAFYPDDRGNWRIGYIDGVPTWLPKLQKVPLVQGVGGVRTLAKGDSAELAYHDAIEKIRRKGGIVIDRREDYCWMYPARDPRTRASGFVYHDPFESPRVNHDRDKRTVKYDQDHAARDAWLLDLMQRGVLPYPDPAILDLHKAQIVARVAERATRRGLPVPEDRSKVDLDKVGHFIAEAVRRADLVEAAEVPAPDEEEAPKPKARRRRSRLAPADAGLDVAMEIDDA